MKTRCAWVPKGNTLYEKYHDEEWGVPVHNDTKHFEFLVLESAQAGLSWETILKRRQGYREAFADFDPIRVAGFSPGKIESLLQNPGIIRNRMKVEAAVHNARQFLEIQRQFTSFDNYVWQFVGGKPILNSWRTIHEVPSQSPEAVELSRDLKKRGFKFVGPTIIYAHMQAVGMVNDHTTDCFRYSKLDNIV